MILHSVYCNLRCDSEPRAAFALFRALEALCSKLDGALSFEFGPNRDFEAKSDAYDVGFAVRFQDRDALLHYAEHPEHKELGAKLCALCVGGADGIMVFDLEIKSPRASA